MTDEYAKLLAFQQHLENETDGKIKFFGLSVNETIRACILNGFSKRADKIKSDFKVPDKRFVTIWIVCLERCVIVSYENSFWYLKLYALTEAKDFEGLDAFGRSKRSPIGYEPFVHHLVEKGHPKEAAAYVPKCDSPKRADLYVECGDWRNAARECKERNDKSKLECVDFLLSYNLFHFMWRAQATETEVS